MKRFLQQIACMAIFLSATACSGDTTDSPDTKPDYLKIGPTSDFTFDEEDLSKNTFTVEATAGLSWQAVASPSANVTFEGMTGSGSGSFRLTDMPAGITVDIYVQHSYPDGRAELESNRVRVTRTQNAVTLTLDPNKLAFNADDAAKNEIQIRSNSKWTASTTDAGLSFSPTSGTGDATLRITAAPDGKSTLTVTAGEGAETVQRNVEIERTAATDPIPDPIFLLDFGSGAGDVWANTTTAWKTQTGTGADAVTYTVNNVRINKDNYGSAGRYAGASGNCYAKMFYNAETDYLEIREIALPAGKTNYRLSFGTLCRAADLRIRLSADGRRWSDLTFTGSSVYNTWVLSSTDFTLVKPVNKLYIRFLPTGVVQAYGLNFDDIRLTESHVGGQQIALDDTQQPYRWPELPANFESPEADQAIHTNWATTVKTNKTVRNYTYCYDTKRHNPIWVAYPLHDCYSEGGYTRPATDPWTYDPSLDAAVQSKIYPAYEGDQNCYYTHVTLSSTQILNDGYWSRGHLVMSSERGCGDKNNPALLNRQTFYPTNIAPQPASGNYTFASIWGYVESLFSGTRNTDTEFTADDGQTNINRVADTLFMVAGCHYGNPLLIEKDASNVGELSAESKECTMPTHQFKVALRTKKGNTQKRIDECSADELQAIGFWIPTYITDEVTSGQIDRFAKSVAEIEQLTGLTLFPGVPAEVKTSFNHTEWGF